MAEETKTKNDQAETEPTQVAFRAEIQQLLNILVHSLYTEREIFLRELISNASDAADKLRFESMQDPTLLEDDADLRIRINCDPEAGTIAVSDNGIGMSREDVIGLHTGTVYRVYMIGFTPGFPYMGELPEALDTPRRATPRTHIPKGSVAIAQRQTGIYPAVSPGGWQIIGRTPVALFDPRKEIPSFLTMGDAVRFTPITAEEAAQWPL